MRKRSVGTTLIKTVLLIFTVISIIILNVSDSNITVHAKDVGDLAANDPTVLEESVYTEDELNEEMIEEVHIIRVFIYSRDGKIVICCTEMMVINDIIKTNSLDQSDYRFTEE